MTTLSEIAKVIGPSPSAPKGGLFEQIEQLIKSKKKINQTSTGLLTAGKKPRRTESYINQTLDLEQQTELLSKTVQRIRREAQWISVSTALCIMHVHCKRCSATYTTPQGLFLRQDHKTNGSARYAPLQNDELALLLQDHCALPLREIHRQESILLCQECARRLGTHRSTEYTSPSGQLQFQF